MPAASQTEFDISVSRLPGLETFAIFLVVSVSVSENLVSLKKSRSGIRKFGLGLDFRKFGFGLKMAEKN